MSKVFIAVRLLEVQRQRRAGARLLECRLQVNAALCSYGDHTMRSFSRWMPSRPRPVTSPVSYFVLALLAVGLLVAAVFSAGGRVVLGIVLLLVLHRIWDDRRLRLLAMTRPGESICTFARSFDRRGTDFWVVRAVYDEFRPYCTFRGGRLPLRATDSLTDDLHIDGDDLEDIARDATVRVGRVFGDLEANPGYGRVATVGDMVAFVQHQPKAVEPAA